MCEVQIRKVMVETVHLKKIIFFNGGCGPPSWSPFIFVGPFNFWCFFNVIICLKKKNIALVATFKKQRCLAKLAVN